MLVLQKICIFHFGGKRKKKKAAFVQGDLQWEYNIFFLVLNLLTVFMKSTSIFLDKYRVNVISSSTPGFLCIRTGVGNEQ